MFAVTLPPGKYVRHLREERGWTQEDLSRACREAGYGVVRQRVAHFERGGMVSASARRQLELVLGLGAGALDSSESGVAA